MSDNLFGAPTRRVDGPAKVTGQARYAAEWNVPGLLHGAVVSSTIAHGLIRRLDTAAALRVPGVVQVYTHQNRPHLPWFDRSYRDDDAPAGSPFRPLYDDQIAWSGQPVALVVAETPETARHAAGLVQIDYDPAPHQTDLEAQRKDAIKPMARMGFTPPKSRGNAEEALLTAPVRIDAEYRSAAEYHNPIEPHATTVVWDDGGTLTVYEKTQGVQNSQAYLCRVFGLRKDDVRVLSPFVGGAFGSGLRPQYQLFLAVLAARDLKRSVRVELTRQQMFTFGHRPATWQRVCLGAAEDGTLLAVAHEAVAETSQFEDYCETVVNWSGLMYQCANVQLDHKVARLDLYTPIDMRAPGAALGMYALECAMDELAHRAGIDPLALRLLNYAERDQNQDLPFSSKELRACYEQGAARFGWSRRDPRPRAQRDGHKLVGSGMATGAWEAMQMPASARAVLSSTGHLTVSSATADIGTGTYTVLSQLAADRLGLPLSAVTFQLGDSSLPAAPLEGGSWTVSSVGTAVHMACEQLRAQLLELAKAMPDSPLGDATLADVVFAGGRLALRRDPGRAVRYEDALRAARRVCH